MTLYPDLSKAERLHIDREIKRNSHWHKNLFLRSLFSLVKGPVENANGRLRRFIPKKANISKLAPSEVFTAY